MSRGAKVRALFACFGLAGCFTCFSARLVYLQVNQHDEYTALAAQKHVTKQPIYARRGSIQDVHGEMLADNEPLKNVIADGSLITDPAKAAAAIADLLQMDQQELTEKLTTKRRYLVVKKEVKEQVADEIAERLKAQSIRGIYFEQDFERVYPNGNLLCHVLGFINHDHKGTDGVESTMDQYLAGHDGFRYIERDRTGRELVPYRGQERPARDGYNVRLTIDMYLQSVVEEELAACYKKYKPEMATAILLDPKTGRIWAMANRPNFDPNDPGASKPEQMKNVAVINMVEPGSTFKIVTASAALNDHLVDLDTMIFCENGRFNFAGRILKDHGHGFADLSVTNILVHSSNIGAAKLAMKLGDQRFYEYIRSFGFGERTGINLPGEISGKVHPPYQWSKISISRIPMGQGVGVTPLQMVCAVGAVCNGGKLMMPQIIDSVVDGDGSPIVNYSPVCVRQVVDPETTDKVRSALTDVVSNIGTAKLAAVPGYTVGGKTGTAQKVKPTGGYYETKYVCSFIGFLPVKDPQFVCLVMVDDPKTNPEEMYGGTIAAPVFSKIAEKTAHYLNIPPDALPSPSPSVKLTQADQD
jgi:cell division protein FtsI (penicillin-binding protein 3)/stage V sporulation protein D (sporulation-specific penicillin-binding protein)